MGAESERSLFPGLWPRLQPPETPEDLVTSSPSHPAPWVVPAAGDTIISNSLAWRGMERTSRRQEVAQGPQDYEVPSISTSILWT